MNLFRAVIRLCILAFPLFAAVQLSGDVIYLNDGNILLVEKAWEEGEEVKYQNGKEIGSLPKSSVQEIHREQPFETPGARRWVQVSPEARPGPAETSLPGPAPSGTGSAVSKETLIRLRNNLNADPSDAAAKAELVQALNAVASLQVAQGELAAARGSLEEAIRLEKRNAALLSNLAAVSYRMGDYQRAEDLLLACLDIDRKDQRIHFFLGETYYKQEKISQAVSVWSEALQLGPNQAISERLEQARREAGIHDELRALQSTHFYLKYDRKGSGYVLGEQILATLEELYGQLSSRLISRGPEKIAVILYPDQAYFDITRAPSWSGGVYDGKIRIPIQGLYSVTAHLKAALIHELTHCFMLALPGRGGPTWFLEGVAQLEEGRSATEYRKVLRELRKSDRLVPLKSLSGSFISLPESAVELAYAESLSAVEYLVTRFGRACMRNLLDLMGQNYKFENAFQTALQKSVSEFETAWSSSLSE